MADTVVLLSTYNGERYLQAQLDSLLKQSYPIDIVIRDDGSKDHTPAILKEYAEKYSNIKVIYGENLGFVRSLFYLINNVTGYKYYSFADQDDIWLEDKVAVGVSAIENIEEPALYGSCSLLVNDSLETFGTTQTQQREITVLNTIIQNFAPGHTQIVNESLMDILRQHFDLERIFCPDIWVFQIASVTGKIVFDNQPHTLYRQHSSNTLGYGKNKLSWITGRIRRLHNNELNNNCLQVAYFLECFSNYLKPNEEVEIKRFQAAQNNIFKRINYLLHGTKLYRQRAKETYMFKILFLMGKYKMIAKEGKILKNF